MKLPSLGTPEHKHLVDYVCLLRYKTESPSANSVAFLRLPAISKVVGYSASTIRTLCMG